MKSITLVTLVALLTVSLSRKHHRHHKQDGLIDHQKCKKCAEFGQTSPRLWNNILFCGDKMEK